MIHFSGHCWGTWSALHSGPPSFWWTTLTLAKQKGTLSLHLGGCAGGVRAVRLDPVGSGFFNTASIATNVVYLLLASLLFGGTPNQKLTGSLINGVMCLLTENTVSFLFAWFLGVPTGSVWRYKSCLAALVVSILAVGLLVAYFMRRWNSTCALEPLQAAVMSFFPGVVVALNMGLMVSANRQKPTLMNMVLTVGLTVAVLVHIAIVQMFNDQVVQRQSSRFRAQLEQQRAEALLDSYTAQRRLTHEFTNHMSALSALLNQGDMEGARAYIAGVSKAVAAGTTIMTPITHCWIPS